MTKDSQNDYAGGVFHKDLSALRVMLKSYKLRAVSDALLHWAVHAHMPRTACNPPMRFRVLYFEDLNFKHDYKCT